MVEVLLCCAPADSAAAARIAARLERQAEVRVILDDSDEESVAAKAAAGLRDSSGVVMLLSPESVPPQAGRQFWGTVIDHVSGNGAPPAVSVLLRPCSYPRTLERGTFHRWEGEAREVLRALEAWALSLHALPSRRSFEPARLPWFTGRERELAWLWERLVDRSGVAVLVNETPASGKTALAQEFCLQAREHFRDLVWFSCGDLSPEQIAAGLAEQLCLERAGLSDLIRRAGEHRVLLVLDNLPPSVPIPDITLERASVLITARESGMADVLLVEPVSPIEPATPSDPVDLRLLRAMAVCRRDAFPLDFAARIAGLDPVTAAEATSHLIRDRLADPLDETRGILRLNALSATAVDGDVEEERRRHAMLLKETLSAWREDTSSALRLFAEFQPAFRWAIEADWPLAGSLARRAYDLLSYSGRAAEGAQVLASFRDAALQRGDRQTADDCSWELSWARNEPYHGPARAPAAAEQTGFDL